MFKLEPYVGERDLSNFKISKVFSISIYDKTTGELKATWELNDEGKLEIKNKKFGREKKLIFLSFYYIIYID